MRHHAGKETCCNRSTAPACAWASLTRSHPHSCRPPTHLSLDLLCGTAAAHWRAGSASVHAHTLAGVRAKHLARAHTHAPPHMSGVVWATQRDTSHSAITPCSPLSHGVVGGQNVARHGILDAVLCRMVALDTQVVSEDLIPRPLLTSRLASGGAGSKVFHSLSLALSCSLSLSCLSLTLTLYLTWRRHVASFCRKTRS